jgi:hypothetical protein
VRTPDLHTGSLFDPAALAAAGALAGPPAGALGCAVELAACMAQALDHARHHGLPREAVAERMGYYLGAPLSVATLNGHCAQSHADREPTLRQAMAFDAALGRDVLLAMWCTKAGGRQVVNADDAALLEWARLHQQERDIAERKKALQASLRVRGLGVRP